MGPIRTTLSATLAFVLFWFGAVGLVPADAGAPPTNDGDARPQ